MQRALSVLLFLLPLWGSAQLVSFKSYYDPNDQSVVKEVWSATATDTTLKEGLYLLYSPEGMIIVEKHYHQGAIQGKTKIRDIKTGLLTSLGEYTNDQNYWGMQFQYSAENKFRSINYERVTQGKKDTLKDPKFFEKITDSLLINLSHQVTRHSGPVTRLIQNLSVSHGIFSSKYTATRNQDAERNLFTYKTSMLSESLDEYMANDEEIRNFHERYPDTARSGVVLGSVEERLKDYENSDSLEHRFQLGFSLVKELRTIRAQFDSLRSIDSLMSATLASIQSYYVHQHHLPQIYQKRVVPLLDSIVDRYQKEKDLVRKLDKGRKYLEAINRYLDKNAAVARQDSLITQLSDSLFNKFSHQFPHGFREDLDAYHNVLLHYHESESFDVKLSHGESLLKQLQNLKMQFDSLMITDTALSRAETGVREYYKNVQPNIFLTEIEPFLRQMSEFRQYRSLRSCLDQGPDLLKKMIFFESRIEVLKNLDREIQETYALAKKSYQSRYKKIYIKEIEPYEEHIYHYKNLGVLEKKLETGEQLLEKLSVFCTQFEVLNIQYDSIYVMLRENSLRYKQSFPSVKRNEIKGLRLSFTTYKEMERLDPKEDLGNKLVKQLQFLRKVHDTLLVLEDSVRSKTPLVRKMYREWFEGLYQAEVAPLVKAADTFASSSYARAILEQGVKIWNRLCLLEERYPELQQYHSDIEEEYQRFLGLYAYSSQNKTIYRKVKSAYRTFIRNIRQERKLDACLNKERSLYFLLKKVNSLSEDNNSFIIKQLRNSKKPEDLRKIFGIPLE